MDHSALVTYAGRWLSVTRRCVLTLEEAACWATSEYPDAIGWMVDGYSILVECKLTIPDFRRDHYKPAKMNARELGRETMGRERWYLTPEGLLSPNMLPEGYGLLEFRKDRVRRVVEARVEERPGRQDAELPLLLHAVRKRAWGVQQYGERRVRVVCGGEGIDV